MTTKQIRIAMAEVDGQTRRIFHKGLPNYPFNLNAVREVEKKLSITEFREYHTILCKTKDPDRTTPMNPNEYVKMILTFTASERCEAILRLKGLWKE